MAYCSESSAAGRACRALPAVNAQARCQICAVVLVFALIGGKIRATDTFALTLALAIDQLILGDNSVSRFQLNLPAEAAAAAAAGCRLPSSTLAGFLSV